MKTTFFTLIICIMTMSANAGNGKETFILIKTTLGNIKVKLYDDTPLHRDNFIKLVENGFYDSLQFHRIIKDFMIQGGDPESKNASENAQLGAGGPGYTIPAEFVYPKRFHKRGALSAARQGDQVNPQKESSGSQFYIVWGKVQSEAELNNMERNLLNKEMQQVFNDLAKDRQAEIQNLYSNNDEAGLKKLQEELIKLTESKVDSSKVKFTPEQREIYGTIGGTPFLDNDYTVFGEVIEGLDVVDKIQSVETNPGDKPKEPVIMKMKVVKGNPKK